MNDFVELGDGNPGMTNISLNGENYSYPRTPPPVPMKNISREPDGKFKIHQEDGPE
jgi:hypothetical protein